VCSCRVLEDGEDRSYSVGGWTDRRWRLAADHHGLAERDLVLDDNMDRRVNGHDVLYELNTNRPAALTTTIATGIKGNANTVRH
jgi:hypothetical protein